MFAIKMKLCTSKTLLPAYFSSTKYEEWKECRESLKDRWEAACIKFSSSAAITTARNHAELHLDPGSPKVFLFSSYLCYLGFTFSSGVPLPYHSQDCFHVVLLITSTFTGHVLRAWLQLDTSASPPNALLWWAPLHTMYVINKCLCNTNTYKFSILTWLALPH